MDRESGFPIPGSDAEKEAFHKLQARLPDIYRRLAESRQEAHTTIVVPSLTLDRAELAKIQGTMYYEERLLCMLMLLRRPRTRMVFISSAKIHPIITQYYLSFLTGIPLGHAMRRLTMMDTNDTSPKPLTQKILESPWLMDRIRKNIGDPQRAHLVVFNTTPFERTLAVRLGIPCYGTDPDLDYLGSKSGCRTILKDANIPVPYGFENLTCREDIVDALDKLWTHDPNIKRAVVKLNEGFSGKGNAMYDYRPIAAYRDSDEAERKQALENNLANMKFEAKEETWPNFEQQYNRLHGIVEAFIEGENKLSPSVQARVNAIQEPQVISTHDQILGGPTGQMFMGCSFPAKRDYRLVIQEDGRKVAEVLSTKGVMGRFAVDFIMVPDGKGGWDRYAIEINLRRGGTTHPFAMMKFLIEGNYDEEHGIFVSSKGKEKYYFATDNLLDPKYVGMGPEDLIDVMVFNDLHFHSFLQRGVAYHMIGALSECGKLGITCIGDTRVETHELHERTIEVLANECDPVGRQNRLEYYFRAPQNYFDRGF
ncbi:MAG: carboxylate-amine ligase [Acidobacteriota bacterium]|nr:carboxylate-amine ligase [Acidobacteriota bacterium]